MQRARRGRGLRSRGARQPARAGERAASRAAAASSSCAASWTTCDRAAARRRHVRAHEQEAGLIWLSIPLFLATAIEAALAAGRIHAVLPPGRRGPEEGPDRSGDRRRSRGRAGVPRPHRASGFRRTSCSAKSRAPSAADQRAGAATAGSSIRWTARRTSRTASRCSACRSRSRSTGASKWASSTTRSPTSCSRPSAARARGSTARRCASPTSDSSSTRCCAPGFPYSVARAIGRTWSRCSARFSGEAQGVRRLGSAALDLCYVAAGRFDGFWEEGLHAWDMAAGVLIVEEAGGGSRGTTTAPVDLFGRQLVASNGRCTRRCRRHPGRRPPCVDDIDFATVAANVARLSRGFPLASFLLI